MHMFLGLFFCVRMLLHIFFNRSKGSSPMFDPALKKQRLSIIIDLLDRPAQHGHIESMIMIDGQTGGKQHLPMPVMAASLQLFLKPYN